MRRSGVRHNPAVSSIIGRHGRSGAIQERIWGRSSAGRASRSQCEGREFDPPRLHQIDIGHTRWPIQFVRSRGLIEIPEFHQRASLAQDANERTFSSLRHHRNPSLQGIDAHGHSIVVITPSPRPRRLHRTKHRIEPIASCITDQRIQRVLRSNQGKPERIAAGREHVQHVPSCLSARRRLFGCSIVLVRTFHHLARGKTGIRFQCHALRITRVQACDGHAGVQQPWRAFQKHEPHGRIYQLERAMRAGGMIGGTVRIALAGWPAFSILIQCGAKTVATLTPAVSNKLRPLPRPAEILDCFTRQAEWKIKPRYPRTRSLQPGFEMRPVCKFFQGVETKCRTVTATAGYGDRFANARAAGEVYAVDGPVGRLTRGCHSG